MNYKDYLRSNHWFEFRRSILLKRKQCQKCCVKTNLNLHHINYRNLGKETNDDIIVLCQTCHNKFHKKKKWKNKMKMREDLNFTITTKPDNKIYSASDTLRFCGRCGNEHPVFYRIFKNGKKTLAMACPNSKPRVTFLPFEELDLPILSRNKGAIDNSDL